MGTALTYVWSTNGVQIATGVRPTVTLPFGAHTVTLTVDDGRSGTDTDTVVIQIAEDLLSVSVDGVAHDYPVLSYAPVAQDGQNGLPSNVDILDGGTTLRISGNAWKKIDLGSYTVATNTILTFDFSSSAQSEIHGIGFDVDDEISPENAFQLYGSQVWGLQDYVDYAASAPGVKRIDSRGRVLHRHIWLPHVHQRPRRRSTHRGRVIRKHSTLSAVVRFRHVSPRLAGGL